MIATETQPAAELTRVWTLPAPHKDPRILARLYDEDVHVEVPTGSGRRMSFAEAADSLTDRLVAAFLPDIHGRRPVSGDAPVFDDTAHWQGDALFHEYLHGDTGEGLGATHQTGWTALVANLLLQRGTRLETP